MTSFTAVSGPLDNVRQALDLTKEADDRVWDFVRKVWSADASVSALASIAGDLCVEAETALTKAVSVLEALDRIIMAEDPQGASDE